MCSMLSDPWVVGIGSAVVTNAGQAVLQWLYHRSVSAKRERKAKADELVEDIEFWETRLPRGEKILRKKKKEYIEFLSNNKDLILRKLFTVDRLLDTRCRENISYGERLDEAYKSAPFGEMLIEVGEVLGEAKRQLLSLINQRRKG
ncbi:hypothetical protein ES703_25151 [subsurface metagenome]|nr:hypothetical protein [bacterium]